MVGTGLVTVPVDPTVPAIPVGPTAATVASETTADVDYTTNTVSMTLPATYNGYTDSFSNFTLSSPSANNYTITATGSSNTADTLSFSYMGQGPSTISNVALTLNGASYTAPSDSVASAAVCFAQGTRILVERAGHRLEIAVEDLRIGDLAITSTGAARPIIWLGRRKVNIASHPRPADVMPIRIEAGAFGEGRPKRDLVVSPGHGLCLDLVGEVLIPAGALVNGATVRVEPMQSVVYWHVELESHDIIVADGLPAESYIESNNRIFFATEGVVALDATPDAERDLRAGFCRPFHADGPLVDVVRARLAAQACSKGWRIEPAGADLHLLVDGERIEPSMSGSTATFLVHRKPTSVCVASETFVPAHTSGSHDRRSLGVKIFAMTATDGFGRTLEIALDDDRLNTGFYDIEQSDGSTWRWTNGRLSMPTDYWSEMTGPFFLRIELLDLQTGVCSVWSEPPASLADAAHDKYVA